MRVKTCLEDNMYIFQSVSQFSKPKVMKRRTTYHKTEVFCGANFRDFAA